MLEKVVAGWWQGVLEKCSVFQVPHLLILIQVRVCSLGPGPRGPADARDAAAPHGNAIPFIEFKNENF
jgi:hypothetical protein